MPEVYFLRFAASVINFFAGIKRNMWSDTSSLDGLTWDLFFLKTSLIQNLRKWFVLSCTVTFLETCGRHKPQSFIHLQMSRNVKDMLQEKWLLCHNGTCKRSRNQQDGKNAASFDADGLKAQYLPTVSLYLLGPLSRHLWPLMVWGTCCLFMNLVLLEISSCW